MNRFCPQCEATYPADVKRCAQDGTLTLLVSEEGMWEQFRGCLFDGRWLLEDLIGQGGMGAVFCGYQLKHGQASRRVAVKILRKDISSDREAISRFFREAKILSHLQHPHIVTMLDFGQDEATGSLYMVMELLEGRSLAELLATGEAISLVQILSMAEQLASALGKAHAQGVVHRDLKPENLFLKQTHDGDLQLVVLDFGVAKVNDNSLTRLTKTGFIQGTPAYMAPEQAEGRSIGHATDLYAVGILLYELASGYEPFCADGVMQLLLKHINEAPPPLAEHWILAEPVQKGYITLTHQLLAKKPKDRPKDAQALRTMLLALLAQAQATPAPPSDSRPARVPERGALGASEKETGAGVAASRGGYFGRDRAKEWALVVAGAAAVVLVGVLVAKWYVATLEPPPAEAKAVEEAPVEPEVPETAELKGAKSDPEISERVRDEEPREVKEETEPEKTVAESAPNEAKVQAPTYKKHRSAGGKWRGKQKQEGAKLNKILDGMRGP